MAAKPLTKKKKEDIYTMYKYNAPAPFVRKDHNGVHLRQRQVILNRVTVYTIEI